MTVPDSGPDEGIELCDAVDKAWSARLVGRQEAVADEPGAQAVAGVRPLRGAQRVFPLLGGALPRVPLELARWHGR